MTSVRLPCHIAIGAAKGGLEPAFQLPKTYPFRFCGPGRRFSVSIIVRQ
jgi:hypothetical protein